MFFMVLQENGNRFRLVAYFTSELDLVAAELPIVLRVVAAAENPLWFPEILVGY